MVLHKKKKKEIANAKYKNETIEDIGSHKVSCEKELIEMLPFSKQDYHLLFRPFYTKRK